MQYIQMVLVKAEHICMIDLATVSTSDEDRVRIEPGPSGSCSDRLDTARPARLHKINLTVCAHCDERLKILNGGNVYN